ncbi:MAG: class I adenylate-forming enzyme family protein [Acidimicrobiales bacterium]
MPSDDLLTGYAALIPDKVALVEDLPGAAPRSWTFAELEVWANRIASAIADLGVARGERVVWCSPNSATVVAITHGCRKAGVVAVPLNYRLTTDEAGYILDNCDAQLAFVDAEYASLITGARAAAPSLRSVLSVVGTAVGCDDGDALIASSAPAFDRRESGGTMIYTSGTTGRPKGAVRTSTPSSEQAASLIQLIGYVPDDVYLTTGPLYHSGPGGFAGIAAALTNTVVVQRKFEPQDWLRLVETYRVSTTFSAPTPIRMVCALPDDIKARYDRTSMRRMIANAAPWSMTLKQAYLADFPPDSLWEVYGSTELGVDTVMPPSDHLLKPGSCGRAAPGVQIVLFDDDGHEVTSPDVPGELYVRSASMFNAYHKASDKYDEDRRGDLHTVGDVAYFDADGYYYICDRKKDMIISGGMNIYPAEIEAALEESPDIYEAAVFGVPSEEWGESVHATVVTRPGASVATDDVVAFARTRLAGYKVPRSVTFVDELPRTGSGKILKRVLREPFWEGRTSRVG